MIGAVKSMSISGVSHYSVKLMTALYINRNIENKEVIGDLAQTVREQGVELLCCLQSRSRIRVQLAKDKERRDSE